MFYLCNRLGSLNAIAHIQGCAALAALCLRNETNSRHVVAIGGPCVVSNGMHIHAANVRVQRHACQALRNMVARTPELRDASAYICPFRIAHRLFADLLLVVSVIHDDLMNLTAPIL